ncbi:hypothetical protein ElyMa_006022000 [Elysia marginata]|uniref:Uncharacterized protein n=1 Tax=Elysia marginata TaxID=1093978 RepID=A0AAV4GI88_9GAST|nr:hypothetical protein ElyMa_006022000 [Elysia marginata]
MNEINTKKAQIHRSCHQKSENRPLCYSIDGQSGGLQERGRPAMSLMDKITTITGLSLDEVLHRSRDREGGGGGAVLEFIGRATIEHGVDDD